MDATEITAIRTAAVSGVATRLLAREDAGILRSLAQALRRKPISKPCFWLERSAVCASERNPRTDAVCRTRVPAPQYALELSPTVQGAVQGADIICTTTSPLNRFCSANISRPAATSMLSGRASPLHESSIQRLWSSPGSLWTAGIHSQRSRRFSDSKKEGAITDNHILGEIGEILLERVKGRRSREEITLFKSLGLAVEDLASANHIYRKALAGGMGTKIELGGSRQ